MSSMPGRGSHVGERARSRSRVLFSTLVLYLFGLPSPAAGSPPASFGFSPSAHHTRWKGEQQQQQQQQQPQQVPPAIDSDGARFSALSYLVGGPSKVSTFFESKYGAHFLHRSALGRASVTQAYLDANSTSAAAAAADGAWKSSTHALYNGGLGVSASGSTVLVNTFPLSVAERDLEPLIRQNEVQFRSWGSSTAMPADMTYEAFVKFVEEDRKGSAVITVQNEASMSSQLQKFHRELQEQLSLPVSMNVYHSGPEAVALKPHTDMYDVFVVQLQGKKEWELCMPFADLQEERSKYPSHPFTAADFSDMMEAKMGSIEGCTTHLIRDSMRCSNVSMTVGDSLYLPKGIVHSATTSRGYNVSTHVTLALHRDNLAFGDLLRASLLSYSQEVSVEPRLYAAAFRAIDKIVHSPVEGLGWRRVLPTSILPCATTAAASQMAPDADESCSSFAITYLTDALSKMVSELTPRACEAVNNVEDQLANEQYGLEKTLPYLAEATNDSEKALDTFLQAFLSAMTDERGRRLQGAVTLLLTDAEWAIRADRLGGLKREVEDNGDAIEHHQREIIDSIRPPYCPLEDVFQDSKFDANIHQNGPRRKLGPDASSGSKSAAKRLQRDFDDMTRKILEEVENPRISGIEYPVMKSMVQRSRRRLSLPEEERATAKTYNEHGEDDDDPMHHPHRKLEEISSECSDVCDVVADICEVGCETLRLAAEVAEGVCNVAADLCAAPCKIGGKRCSCDGSCTRDCDGRKILSCDAGGRCFRGCNGGCLTGCNFLGKNCDSGCTRSCDRSCVRTQSCDQGITSCDGQPCFTQCNSYCGGQQNCINYCERARGDCTSATVTPLLDLEQECGDFCEQSKGVCNSVCKTIQGVISYFKDDGVNENMTSAPPQIKNGFKDLLGHVVDWMQSEIQLFGECQADTFLFMYKGIVPTFAWLADKRPWNKVMEDPRPLDGLEPRDCGNFYAVAMLVTLFLSPWNAVGQGLGPLSMLGPGFLLGMGGVEFTIGLGSAATKAFHTVLLATPGFRDYFGFGGESTVEAVESIGAFAANDIDFTIGFWLDSGTSLLDVFRDPLSLFEDPLSLLRGDKQKLVATFSTCMSRAIGADGVGPSSGAAVSMAILGSDKLAGWSTVVGAGINFNLLTGGRVPFEVGLAFEFVGGIDAGPLQLFTISAELEADLGTSPLTFETSLCHTWATDIGDLASEVSDDINAKIQDLLSFIQGEGVVIEGNGLTDAQQANQDQSREEFGGLLNTLGVSLLGCKTEGQECSGGLESGEDLAAFFEEEYSGANLETQTGPVWGLEAPAQWCCGDMTCGFVPGADPGSQRRTCQKCGIQFHGCNPDADRPCCSDTNICVPRAVLEIQGEAQPTPLHDADFYCIPCVRSLPRISSSGRSSSSSPSTIQYADTFFSFSEYFGEGLHYDSTFHNYENEEQYPYPLIDFNECREYEDPRDGFGQQNTCCDRASSCDTDCDQMDPSNGYNSRRLTGVEEVEEVEGASVSPSSQGPDSQPPESGQATTPQRQESLEQQEQRQEALQSQRRKRRALLLQSQRRRTSLDLLNEEVFENKWENATDSVPASDKEADENLIQLIKTEFESREPDDIPPEERPAEIPLTFEAALEDYGGLAPLVGLDEPGRPTNITFSVPVVTFEDAPYSAQYGDSVTFDASGTYDPDGREMVLGWLVADRNLGCEGLVCTFLAFEVGVLEVSLEACNTAKLCSQAETMLTVESPPPPPAGQGEPQALVLDAGEPYTIAKPMGVNSVTFQAQASGGAQPALYRWLVDGVQLEGEGCNTSQCTYTPLDTAPVGEALRVEAIVCTTEAVCTSDLSSVTILTDNDDINNPGGSGDPMIFGLQQQVFLFEGRDERWYNGITSPRVDLNWKLNAFLECENGLNPTYFTANAMSLKNKDGSVADRVLIEVMDRDVFFPGCPLDEEVESCLAEGNLRVVLNEEIITKPGAYALSGGGLMYVFNAYGPCTYKRDVHMENDLLTEKKRLTEAKLLERRRRLTDLDPSGHDALALVHSRLSKFEDGAACLPWYDEKMKTGELYQKNGGWASVYIETVDSFDFHIEYRQEVERCHSHSIDTFIVGYPTDTDTDLTEWQGVLGETRQLKYNTFTGQPILRGREQVLSGSDASYEVEGPWSFDFKARKQ